MLGWRFPSRSRVVPRQKRADEKRADEKRVIYHALSRGNQRQNIFGKEADYDAFVRVLHEGVEKYAVELFLFTLLPNHWHVVLRPAQDGQMGRRFVGCQRLTHCGTMRTTIDVDTVDYNRGDSEAFPSKMILTCMSLCRTEPGRRKTGRSCWAMEAWIALSLEPTDRSTTANTFTLASPSTIKLD